jgi:hypothetical protein
MNSHPERSIQLEEAKYCLWLASCLSWFGKVASKEEGYKLAKET